MALVNKMSQTEYVSAKDIKQYENKHSDSEALVPSCLVIVEFQTEIKLNLNGKVVCLFPSP